MEFKNLERTRFNWFATKEIKDLELVEDKLPFITKFSFGPFVPYYLYLFFHNLWDFLILEFVAGFIIGIIAYIAIIFNFLSSDSGNSAMLSYFPHLILLVILVLIVVFGVKIYQGINCRRLSWNRCEWKDYESFELGEKNWNIAGLVFFILQLSLLIVIAILIFFYLKTLAGAHY